MALNPAGNYGVSIRTQYECGKIRTRKTPHTDTFHAAIISNFYQKTS